MANLHCHTFFSFNAYGHSPTSLAWLARREGWRLVGSVDFDVLDGVDEMVAGIETRVHVPELAAHEINSPGEPGIAYHMGIGFVSSRVPEGVAPILTSLRERASRRTRDMMARINRHLAPLTVEWERDVLPLTPAGNATERHLLAAYLRAAAQLRDPAGFWADRLDRTRAQVEPLLADPVRLQNLVRARLMKRGGVGYVQPESGAFPSVDEFHDLILACGALPCATWLDGTSSGEAAAAELLDLWLARGVAVLNIIPDRNWNIADPESRALKVRKLHEIARLAAERDLPLIAGTEMNAPGQKRVDDFDAPELAPLHAAFMEGGYMVYGHTVLQRALALGWGSEWARELLPGRRQCNAFFAQVGRLAEPGEGLACCLEALAHAPSPAQVLARLRAR